MSFTIESLIVLVIAVLPGFVSSAARATLRPGDSPSAGEWVAASIVASLALNAFAFFIYIFCFGGVDLTHPLSDTHRQFAALTGWTALQYVGLLYLLALIWGVASALTSDRFAPSVLAYRLRLTPISPTPTVFIDVLQQLVGSPENCRLRGRPDQQVAWLRVRRDGKVIQGRIAKTSVAFAVSEPIEIYLSPAYVFDGGVIIERDQPLPEADILRGFYLRLRPEDIAELLVVPASWRPLTAQARAGQIPAPAPPGRT